MPLPLREEEYIQVKPTTKSFNKTKEDNEEIKNEHNENDDDDENEIQQYDILTTSNPSTTTMTSRDEPWSKIEDRYLQRKWKEYRNEDTVYLILSKEDMFQARDRTPTSIQQRVELLELNVSSTLSSFDSIINSQSDHPSVNTDAVSQTPTVCKFMNNIVTLFPYILYCRRRVYDCVNRMSFHQVTMMIKKKKRKMTSHQLEML